MLSTILISAVLATAVYAQNPALGLASCAGACLGSGYGGCKALDVACICSNKQLISDLSCCVKYNCPQEDQDKTINFAHALCGGYHVNDLPNSASCAPGQQPTGASGAKVSVTRVPDSATAGSSSGPATASATSTTGTGTMPQSTNSAATPTSAGAGANTASTSRPAGGAAMATAAPVMGLGGLLFAGVIAAL